MARAAKVEDRLLSVGAMADLLGISVANLKHHEDHLPYHDQRGNRRLYNDTKTVQAYINMLKAGHSEENTVAGRKLKLVKQQERKLRLQNDTTAGILMKSDDSIHQLQEVVAIMRAGADALPGRVAQQLSGMSKPSEVRGLLEQELDEIFAMAEAALRSHREAIGLGGESGGEEATADSADGTGSTTKKVSRRVGGRKSNSTKGKRGTRKVA